MRAVVQRVLRAAVSVGGETISEIGPGICVLLGVGEVIVHTRYIPAFDEAMESLDQS